MNSAAGDTCWQPPFEPATYRQIIDDVIANIKGEFDDYGVSEDILSDLQSVSVIVVEVELSAARLCGARADSDFAPQRWENKVIASNVAEFEPQPPAAHQAAAHHHYPPHVMQHPSLPPIHAAFPQYAPSPSQTPVKAEPIENRFPLPSNMPTYMPTLPGPTLPGPPRPAQIPAGVTHHYNGVPPRQQPYSTSASPAPSSSQPRSRIPQVDGTSSSDSDSASPPPSQSYAPPRSLHPSLPQPAAGAAQNASEEINSDLDDSDSEAEEEDQEGALGETDIVFCTYDKVCSRIRHEIQYASHLTLLIFRSLA